MKTYQHIYTFLWFFKQRNVGASLHKFVEKQHDLEVLQMLITAGKLIFQNRATPLMENCKPAKSPPCTVGEHDSSWHLSLKNSVKNKCGAVLTGIFHMKIFLMKNIAFF